MDRLRHHLTLGNEDISYLLVRSPRRRSIGLRIDTTGLIVSIPARLPQHEAEKVLARKSAWILARLYEMRNRAAPPFVWQAGQMLPFLGSPIELSVEPGSARTKPLLAEGVLRIFMPGQCDADALANRVLQ